MVHDESFYINTQFNESLLIEPNYQLYIYLAEFLNYFGYESSADNKKVLSDIINTNRIGIKWFDTKRVGWVSLMGDSGSGFYSVNSDEFGNQFAQLVGINIEGCTMIKLRPVKIPQALTANIFVNWDESKNQLIIGNYEIITAQKCSLVHSIAHIEQMLRDTSGEHVEIS